VSDPASRLFVALSRINRMLRRDAPAQLGQGGVSALATIVWYGPLRSGDLAAKEGVSPPTMTRIVAGLEATGYAGREPDPLDGRACLVRATARGQELINGNSSAVLDILRERVGRLSGEQRAALLAALPALDSLSSDD
jgi:DNA-binding MarR family transcriptional regulator